MHDRDREWCSLVVMGPAGIAVPRIGDAYDFQFTLCCKLETVSKFS